MTIIWVCLIQYADFTLGHKKLDSCFHLSSFRKLGLAFNLEYLSNFFINFNIQWQFLNPHDEQIKNQSLIFEFDEEILEIIGNEKDETKLFYFICL